MHSSWHALLERTKRGGSAVTCNFQEWKECNYCRVGGLGRVYVGVAVAVVVVEDGDKFDDQGRCQNAVFGPSVRQLRTEFGKIT